MNNTISYTVYCRVLQPTSHKGKRYKIWMHGGKPLVLDDGQVERDNKSIKDLMLDYFFNAINPKTSHHFYDVVIGDGVDASKDYVGIVTARYNPVLKGDSLEHHICLMFENERKHYDECKHLVNKAKTKANGFKTELELLAVYLQTYLEQLVEDNETKLSSTLDGFGYDFLKYGIRNADYNAIADSVFNMF